mmetsp:Transcript_10874/g.22645  ORF Transcript_10874/g.22645 Transcript_10874/m.22645 type:complete len:273 (+) Transcript_10874:336-1154(+)
MASEGETEAVTIAQVIKTATAAVQADGQGNLEDAIALYSQATSQLEKLIAAGGGSESEVEDWQSKVQQYKTRVTYLNQRLQAVKLEQYAQTAKLAQDGMSIAAKGQEAVKVAGGPSPLAGAAAVGAGLGLVLAGPIGALAGAAGIAYAATTKDNGMGEAARATGQVAVDAYSGVKKFDQDHNISSKAYTATVAGVNKVTEIEQKYQVKERVGNVLSKTTASITEFEKKNKVVEKIGSGLAGALDWTTSRLGGSTPKKKEDIESRTFPEVPQS